MDLSMIGHKLARTYEPRLAIIVYQYSDYKYFLESHTISKTGQILEGKPLQQDTISEMIDMFYHERKEQSNFSGFYPENLLSFHQESGSKYHLVWYQPSCIKMIHFSSYLKIPSGMAMVPAMLYIANGKDMYVYALDSNERPTTTSKIYKAPYHNIYADGKVCLGSAEVKKPEKTYQAVMQYWEDLFWKSEFTQLNGTIIRTKSNINTLWKNNIKAEKKAWDNDELIREESNIIKQIFK